MTNTGRIEEGLDKTALPFGRKDELEPQWKYECNGVSSVNEQKMSGAKSQGISNILSQGMGLKAFWKSKVITEWSAAIFNKSLL